MAFIHPLIHSLPNYILNVDSFGAAGDGTTDDTSAINAAIASAGDNSQISFTQGKTYKVTSSSGLQIVGRTNVTIEGNQATLKCATNARAFLVDTSARIRITGLNITGTIQDDAYASNSEQGRIVVQNSSYVRIDHNHWFDTAGACFLQTGASKVWFQDNFVLNTHSGIQTSSAVYTDVSIINNYFLGHVYNIADQGSDDQIALFGSSAGTSIISGNIIDKQGPTVYNQARAININCGTPASNSNIIVSNNIVKNVATSTAAQGRGAIVLAGTNSTKKVHRITVSNNTITNCNIPIDVGAFVENLNCNGNVINGAITLASFSNSGKAIVVASGGALEGFSVSENIIDSPSGDGINISSTAKTIVRGNLVRSSGSVGIRLDTVTDCLASGNMVVASTSTGILVNNSTRTSLVGNSALGGSAWGIQYQGAANSGTCVGNIANGNASGQIRDTSTATTLRVVENNTIGTRGLSGTDTPAQNLGGTKTLSSGTGAVTFALAEPDTSYRIILGGNAAESFSWASKATSGFTINSSNGSSTAIVDWMIVR